MQAFQDPLSAFAAQAVPIPASKSKFVEGTVYQLARALYEVHTAHESQPALAIQETLQRMNDNTDRRAILLEARISAEALARRRVSLLKSGKALPQQQLTLFDQLQMLKQAKITRLKSEKDKFLTNAKVEFAAPSTPVDRKNRLNETFLFVSKRIQRVENELLEAIYSDKQVVKATARLERIKKWEKQKDESEDTVPQMMGIWRQLAQALLLQKLALSKPAKDSAVVSFENVPSTSKEPIATLWRFECGKLSRLMMGAKETVRTFASRCKNEERYCAWLATLHVLEENDTKFASQLVIFDQMKSDNDSHLFIALSAAIPAAYALMRLLVERDAPEGTKFAALCIAIEGEANFVNEHTPQTTTVSFLDASQEHMANVALASRIAKDPRGKPVKESHSESYSKSVSTDYEMKAKREKRKKPEQGDESEGETLEPEGVMALQSYDNPHFEHLWNRVLALEASGTPAVPLVIAPKRSTTLACFDFRNKGKCERGEQCHFLHDSTKSQNPTGYEKKVRVTSRSPPPRFSEGLGRPKSRSPPSPSFAVQMTHMYTHTHIHILFSISCITTPQVSL